MDWQIFLLVFFGAMFALMLTGMPVAFVFLLINLVAVVWLWPPGPGLNMLVLNMRDSISSFVMLPIPMFVLLGEVMFHSGIAMRMIDVIDKWFGKLRGRLALLTVAASTLFSTMSGSTIGTTAMMGTLVVPEMERRGYKRVMSIGAVMGSGGLAMIIPPSGTAVLLAAMAQISVGKLLIAGIIPGLLIAIFYATYIIGRCYIQPSIAPAYDVPPTPLRETLGATLRYVLPLSVIIFLVLGLIFLGVATPTESAATGALGSLILAAMYRKLSWDVIRKSIMGTVGITTMILMIIVTATTYAQILTFTGTMKGLTNFVLSLPVSPIAIVVAMMVLLVFAGCFIGLVPMIMIFTPIFFPVVQALGFDPIWFGLLMIINLEMAQTTPPFGTLLFVMKGVAPAGTTMTDIYKAGIPFLLCDFAAMMLVLVFPILALWLPGML